MRKKPSVQIHQIPGWASWRKSVSDSHIGPKPASSSVLSGRLPPAMAGHGIETACLAVRPTRISSLQRFRGEPGVAATGFGSSAYSSYSITPIVLVASSSTARAVALKSAIQ